MKTRAKSNSKQTPRHAINNLLEIKSYEPTLDYKNSSTYKSFYFPTYSGIKFGKQNKLKSILSASATISHLPNLSSPTKINSFISRSNSNSPLNLSIIKEETEQTYPHLQVSGKISKSKKQIQNLDFPEQNAYYKKKLIHNMLPYSEVDNEEYKLEFINKIRAERNKLLKELNEKPLEKENKVNVIVIQEKTDKIGTKRFKNNENKKDSENFEDVSLKRKKYK